MLTRRLAAQGRTAAVYNLEHDPEAMAHFHPAEQLSDLFFASKSLRTTKPTGALSGQFNWGPLPCYSGFPLVQGDGKRAKSTINQGIQEVA
jgi:hypothetical protein